MNPQKSGTNTTVATTSPSRTFMARVILIWMLVVLIYWSFTKHLPSQFTPVKGVDKPLFPFLADIGLEKLKSIAGIAEIIFSVSLIILLFIPASRKWLYVHIAALLFFALSMLAVRSTIVIPVTAYILLLISLFFLKEEKFVPAFDFILTLVVVLSLVYAAEYFVRWYQTLRTPSSLTLIRMSEPKFSQQQKLLYRVVPWFYVSFIVLIIRIFTTKLNNVLLIICILLLAAEFYLNNFFDPGLTFMLFPFINWQNIFKKFNYHNSTK